MYQYFLKVVPTLYSDVRNDTTHTNQYSVTENFRDGGPQATGRMLPGVFFFYDLSPIKVGGWGGRGAAGGLAPMYVTARMVRPVQQANAWCRLPLASWSLAS
jgi:hypothetical protein